MMGEKSQGQNKRIKVVLIKQKTGADHSTPV
jgi:hypothetical protein